MSHPRSADGSRRSWRVLVTLLALLISCTEQSTTDVSPAAPALVRGLDAKPVFTMEPSPISVPTYDGSGQAVHPDVVSFDTDWHGARYWMTMTPYPKSDQTLENPSILRSDDGLTVSEPAGLKNPVIKPPRRSRDYNSDPELLYEPETDRLVLFYRLVEKKANTIHVATSRDGVTWTHSAAPFWERSHRAVSPTVAPRPGKPAMMWYVDAGKDGCDAAVTRVLTRTAADATGRITNTQWIGPSATDLSIPGYNIWHIKARWIPAKSEYWMLMSAYPVNGAGCHTDDLFFARSADGVHWTTYADPIVRHEDRAWTAASVYRSTFLYDAQSDELRLWISAQGSDGAWRVGVARARFESLVSTLRSGGRLSPHATAFAAPSVDHREQP